MASCKRWGEVTMTPGREDSSLPLGKVKIQHIDAPGSHPCPSHNLGLALLSLNLWTLCSLQSTAGLRTWESPEDSKKNGQWLKTHDQLGKAKRTRSKRSKSSLSTRREGRVHLCSLVEACLGTKAEVTAVLGVGATVSNSDSGTFY